MCGIAGYVGSRDAAPIVIECLKRLEYRGYDSCGIAVETGGKLFVRKSVGTIDAFREELAALAPSGVIGVGHTRWATHGKVDLRNAHPHISCDGTIAAVHNGVIENAAVLRAELVEQGHTFLSDTDSEVVPHLLEEGMRNGQSFERAFLGLQERLRGTYAMLALQEGSDYVCVTRKGSPLVVGVGDGEYFPASDIPSFLPITPRVVYLGEDECFVIHRDGMERLSLEGDRAVRRKTVPAPQSVSISPESISKGTFEHFMIKEILEQTGTLERIIQRAPVLIGDVMPVLRDARDIVFVGAGTSYHACLFGQYLFSAVARRHVDAYVSSDFENHAELLGPGSTVVALTQSGETLDTLEALHLAKDRGAQTIAVTNVELSSVARVSDHVIPLFSGPELAVAATKSYTAQLAIVTLFGQVLSPNGASSGTQPLWQARDALFNLTSEAARHHTRELGRDLLGPQPVFLTGRGRHYVTALESALKLKEVAGLKAEALHGGEMKHGTLALVENGTPAIHFYDQHELTRTETAASELKARGARIISVGPQPLPSSDHHIRVDDAGVATPIVQVIPMQILAYELAKLKSMDPDRPRNLAKSVTVP
ncbi:MAG: glutamine--fructose-6-phosphate transaminase (isomerizing) [Thermoplasmata archaeon]